MSDASGVGLDAESSQMATALVRKKRKRPAMANAVAGPSKNPAEEHNKRGRRKLGLLAGLPNLPLDILFEVNLKFFLLQSSHLHARSSVTWILTTF